MISLQYSLARCSLPSQLTPARHPEATAIVQGLRRIVHALERYSREVRRDYGLTAPQLWALATLHRHGPVTTGRLAAALHVHQSSASVLLQRMERRGLVRRSRAREDRRRVRVELTERGAALAREAPQPAQGRLLHALAGMPLARVREIRGAVDDLVKAMEADRVEARFFFSDG